MYFIGTMSKKPVIKSQFLIPILSKPIPGFHWAVRAFFLMAILCGGDYDKVSHFNLFLFSYSNLNIRSD